MPTTAPEAETPAVVVETPAAGVDVARRAPAPPPPDPDDDPGTWPEGTYIEDDGARFRVAEEVGTWPLMEFAKVASQGADSETMEGLVAIFDLCRDFLDPRDFRRFGEHCTVRKYKGDQILELVTKAMGVVSATPSGSPSGSPGGAANTSPSSNGTSTRPASSPNTGPPQRPVTPIQEVPEADRETYMQGLTPADRRRAMGIEPIG
jgi:hypothetical protein